GYSAEEMIGHHLFEFMDGAARVTLAARLERRRHGITEEHDDFMFLHRDGHPVWTRLSAAPLTDTSGEYSGSVALITDVTDRRESEQALVANERRFRAVVQNSSDVVTITNAEGLATYVSP